MDINAANMRFLFQAVSLRFKDAFETAREPSYEQFTMTERLATHELQMPFLEQLTGMREWVGPRVVNNMATNKMTIVPRKFELTYGIPADAVKDDQYGMYASLFAHMATQAARLPNDLVETLLNNAATAKWCDGGNFFGTTRKYGKNAVANLTTEALSETSLKAAWTAMRGYKGHGGVSLRVNPTLLVHGPALHWTVNELLESPVKGDANGATVPNPVYHLVGHLEVQNLEGNKWFLCASNGVYKPVCYFEREAPGTLVRKDRPEDDNVFNEDSFLYGVTGRAEAAFVMPHLIYFGNAS